eukprot:TRINITY_DN1809_c0_g1_i1.p1 TRINITY_DN1809_c0_g1~~TRINITY_DN1809_c0_g1_i1.p1  ORF type:complete len:186 (+),score=33.71 TRINITY_DN1809_c0_g1_i1:35-559(+)
MVTRPFLSFFAASCRSSWILDAQGVGTGRSAVQHEKKKKKSREVAVRLAWPAANAEGRQEECADSRRPHRQSVPALGQVPGGQRGLCRRAPRPNSRPAAMAALSGTLSAARMTIFRENTESPFRQAGAADAPTVVIKARICQGVSAAALRGTRLALGIRSGCMRVCAHGTTPTC